MNNLFSVKMDLNGLKEIISTNIDFAIIINKTRILASCENVNNCLFYFYHFRTQNNFADIIQTTLPLIIISKRKNLALIIQNKSVHFAAYNFLNIFYPFQLQRQLLNLSVFISQLPIFPVTSKKNVIIYINCCTVTTTRRNIFNFCLKFNFLWTWYKNILTIYPKLAISIISKRENFIIRS